MYFINQIFVARRLSILISKRIQSNIFIITKKTMYLIHLKLMVNVEYTNDVLLNVYEVHVMTVAVICHLTADNHQCLTDQVRNKTVQKLL